MSEQVRLIVTGVMGEPFDPLKAQLAELKAEVAELRRDRERLDWLDATDKGQYGAFFVWDDGTIACGCQNGGRPIREAVDVAMATKRKGEMRR